MGKLLKKVGVFIIDVLAFVVAVVIVIIDRGQREAMKIKDYLNI